MSSRIPYNGGYLEYRKRVYFGRDSVAKIKYPDNKVDNIRDYKLTTYASLIDLSDLLNQNAFLSHLVWIKDNMEIPVLETYNIKTVIGRLSILAFQLPRYLGIKGVIPKKISELLNNLKGVSVENAKQLIYQTAIEIHQALKDYNDFKYCYDAIFNVKQKGIILSYDFVEKVEEKLRR